MKIKEGKSALEQNLYRSFLLLSATLVLISLGFTLFFDISRQRKDMDKLISGTASYIAAIPDVAAMLENGYPDSTVTRDLDSLSLNIPDINVIVISDKNGLRFYHTDRLKTGDSYVAGDEDAILAGSDPYITTGYGTHGMAAARLSRSKKQRRRDRRFCDGFPVHRYPVRPAPQSAVLLYNYIPDHDDRQHFPDAHNVLPAARLPVGI